MRYVVIAVLALVLGVFAARSYYLKERASRSTPST